MQQVVRLEIWVTQEASRAVKSMLPVESHFSFDFTQFSIAWYWLPQAPAKEFWQEVMSADVRAGSFAQLLLSEHEASLLPQPANAITATVIAAKRASSFRVPPSLTLASVVTFQTAGRRLLHPGKQRKKAAARTGAQSHAPQDTGQPPSCRPAFNRQRAQGTAYLPRPICFMNSWLSQKFDSAAPMLTR